MEHDSRFSKLGIIIYLIWSKTRIFIIERYLAKRSLNSGRCFFFFNIEENINLQFTLHREHCALLFEPRTIP